MFNLTGTATCASREAQVQQLVVRVNLQQASIFGEQLTIYGGWCNNNGCLLQLPSGGVVQRPALEVFFNVLSPMP